jgi:hypothetical protein
MKIIFSKSALLLCFLLITNLVYSQKPTTAIEMNNYLTGVVSSLYEKGVAWGTKLGEAETSKDFSTLKSPRAELEKLIDQKIKEVNGVKDIGGSSEFRQSILSFLKFEKILVQQAFVPFEKLSKTATQEEIDKCTANMNELAKKEAAELDRIRVTQEQYAKSNGFTIQKEEDSDKD